MKFTESGSNAWRMAGSTALLLAIQSTVIAGDTSHPLPTSDAMRGVYTGATFSRLPDHAYLNWLVPVERVVKFFGLSHVEDRGVEMLWLETAELPATPKELPRFTVADVVVLPTGYRAEGLVVTPCGRMVRSSPVVALADPKTHVVRRAWAIDVDASRFVEYFPAADSCSLYAPGDE